MFPVSPLYFLASFVVMVKGRRATIPAELQRLYTDDLANWEAPEEIQRAFPYYLSGHDGDENPVWVLEFGKWDLRSTIEKGEESKKMLDKYVDQTVLRIYNSTFSENGINEVVGIMDWEGYNLNQLNSLRTTEFIISKLRLIFTALGHLKAAYLINTNFFAEGMLNIIRPFLGKEFAKLEVYGTNPAKWKVNLLKHIPREQLPTWYGGSEDFKPVKVYG